MRCYDPPSGCSAEVRVLADKAVCGEYQVSGQDTNVQCWIPVVSGQEITVQCDLEMTSFIFQVDLIVDGVLRNTWVSTIGQKAKLRESHIEFEEGIFKSVRSLHRSPLRTARLGPVSFHLENNPTVGTIEVHISKVEEELTYKHPAALPDDVETWKDLPLAPGTTEIDPTHHIKLSGDERVLESLRKTLRNKWGRPRPGKAAWAVFKFMYRDADVLRSAGLMNPVMGLPILLKDGSTAVHAAETDAEEPLFVGQSQEADNDSNNSMAIDHEGDRYSSQPHRPELPRPAPNMLMADTALHDSASLAESGSHRKRKRANTGAADGTPTTKAMKRRKNDIESLRAQLADLERVRDEARLKHEAELRRTEDEARKLEDEWADLLGYKEHLERAIDDENYGAYAQLQEQRRLKSSMHH